MDQSPLNLSDWRMANLDALNYTLQQAQVRHKYTCELAERISRRGFMLFAFFIPVVGMILHLLISTIRHHEDALGFGEVVMLCIMAAPVIWIMYLTLQLVFPRYRTAEGRIPSAVIKEDLFIEGKLREEHLYRALLINEIKHIDRSIVHNEECNGRRLKRLRQLMRTSMAWLFYTIATLVAIGFDITN